MEEKEAEEWGCKSKRDKGRWSIGQRGGRKNWDWYVKLKKKKEIQQLKLVPPESRLNKKAKMVSILYPL